MLYTTKKVNSFVVRKFEIHSYLKGKKRSKATKKSRYALCIAFLEDFSSLPCPSGS